MHIVINANVVETLLTPNIYSISSVHPAGCAISVCRGGDYIVVHVYGDKEQAVTQTKRLVSALVAARIRRAGLDSSDRPKE